MKAHPIPPVSKYMTTHPILIDADAGLRQADSLMTINRFRHLPVVKDGVAIGVISDRDIKCVRGLHGVDFEATTVGDIVRPHVYIVSPGASIDSVAREMAAQKIGSALVIQNLKIVGIFTTNDALKALCDILNQ